MPDFLDERMIAWAICEKWYHCSCMLADGNIPDCWMCILCKSVQFECPNTHESSVQLLIYVVRLFAVLITGVGGFIQILLYSFSV